MPSDPESSEELTWFRNLTMFLCNLTRSKIASLSLRQEHLTQTGRRSRWRSCQVNTSIN